MEHSGPRARRAVAPGYFKTDRFFVVKVAAVLLTATSPCYLVYTPIMNDARKRTILRWIHIVLAVPIAGYVYSPFEELPNYAPVVRFVSIPVLVLTGLWMWKGQAIRRLFSKRSA